MGRLFASPETLDVILLAGFLLASHAVAFLLGWASGHQ